MVDLNLYRVFYTVVKCGSLTKAAEELFISQPAVSQSIKSLEAQLGGKLFNRVSRGMELSETGGKQMFDIVNKAITMLTQAEERFKESKSIATGQLRITASDTIVTHYLMNYIKKYHELFPNVIISFKDSTTKESLELIKTNKADIAIVNLPIYDKDVIMTGQTGVIEDIFVANEKYKELFSGVMDLRDLPNYPVLFLDTNTTTAVEINNFLDTMNIKIVPEFEVSSVSLLIQMAKNGLGIACISRRFIIEELANGELFEIKVSPSLPLRANGVVLNSDPQNHTFAVKEFLKLLD